MKDENTLLSPAVQSKLRLLRRLLRGRLFAEGLARLALAAAGLVVVTLTLDYSLRLDRPLRGAVLSIGAIFVLHVLWRRVVAPMIAPMNPRSLVLLIERKFPRLDDRLITVLEGTGDETFSRAMLAATAAEAERIISPLPVRNIVETRRLGRLVGFATLVGMLLIGFAILQPGLMRLWFQRNLLFADVNWPQRTYLSIYYVDNAGQLCPLLETGPDGAILRRRETAEVLRGETLDVLVASVEGKATPANVTLHVRYPSVGDTEEKLNPLPPEEAKQYRDMILREGETPSWSAGKMPATRSRTWFRKRFRGVNEVFTFYAVGGDDRRDAHRPHRVLLVEAPALSDVRFTVTHPAYMRRSRPTVLPGSRGVLPIPHGATVHVSALATKPIASAQMRLDDRKPVSMNIDEETSDAPRRRLTGALKPEGKNVPATYTLRFNLRDETGYTSRRPETYILQILPDLPPSVRLQSRGVRNVVCPSARIPLYLEAKDDQGLAMLRAVWCTEYPGAETQPATAPTYRSMGKPIPISPANPRQQSGRRVLDLWPHKLPPGVRLIVRAEARDTLPGRLGGPNTTTGSERTFEVVPREQLLAQLVGLQKEARMELFQAMGQQAFAQGQCTSVVGDLAVGTIRPSVPNKLAGVAARQRQVRNESTKVADSMASVATEMELNRLGTPEEHAALRDNVVTPLRNLIREIRTVGVDLDAARALKDAAKLAQHAKTVAKKQQDIYHTMETILANMRKLEDRLELARRLEGLIKMSVELDAILHRRVERDIEDIFEDRNEQDENQP